MKHNHLALTLILVIVIINIYAHLHAGAWVQKKDGYYLRIYSSYLFATEEFNHRGEKLDLYEEQFAYTNSYFRDISLIIYSEYGLSNNLTLIGELPFKSLTTKRTLNTVYGPGRDEIATTSGFADLKLSGKLKIIEHPFALSFQAGAMIPLGYSKQPENNGPRLGSGDVNLEGHLLFGASFYPLPTYFTGSVGYRHYTGELHDEVILTGEVGYTLGRFFFKSYMEVLRNMTDPPDIYGRSIDTGDLLGGELPDLLIGDQHQTKIIPSITYKVSETFAIQAELIKPLSGVNAISGTTYSLGLVLSN
jgi:hypothetical protein